MKSFRELGLLPELLDAVEKLGYENPTPVQEKTIPYLLEEEGDLIALAQTGTGKTAAFGLPIIQKLNAKKRKPQAIIICPTRELCIQIAKDIESYSKNTKRLMVVAVYGGARIEGQIDKLERGAQIIVSTPGRMNDIIRRQKVDMSYINTVVLDEADEMLNMGFQEELNSILEETPEEKRTLLFSATMPNQVERIAMQYLKDPFKITIGHKNIAAENINHVHYVVHERDRYLALKRIMDINPNIYGIVFCRTRMETKKVAENLIEDGYSADALHGDLSQAQRDYVMSKFRNRNIQMLIATDVAARGLDVDDLTHIINYNLPDDFEVYTHRSGRTGRAGKSGVSVSIINLKERWKIKRIEKIIQKEIKKQSVPNGAEICEKQFYVLIDKIKTVNVNEEQLAPYLDTVYDKLSEFSREEIIKHFISLEFNRLLDYYKKDRDLNVSEKRDRKNDRNDRNGRRDRNDRGGRRDSRDRGKRELPKDEKFARLFVNIGKKDGVRPQDIIGFINESARDKSIVIGAIDLLNNFSFVEIPQKYVSNIVDAKMKPNFNGKTINFEISQDKNKTEKKRTYRDSKSKRKNSKPKKNRRDR